MDLEFEDRILLEQVLNMENLIDSIDTVISNRFVVNPNIWCRTKRAAVHDAIALDLGLTVNNNLCVLIKERLKAKGAKPYTSRSTLYYKFLVWKE